MNNDYIKVYGSGRKQAKESAKHWKASKRRNWKRYAAFKRSTLNDAIEAEEFAREFVTKAFAVRHRDADLFDNLLEALHMSRYLKTLSKLI